MLKVDVIKFEAQDVITASGTVASGDVVMDKCTSNNGAHGTVNFTVVNGTLSGVCSDCGAVVSTSGGNITVAP